VTWTDWPARRAPYRSGLAATIVLVTVGLAAVYDPLLSVLGLVLLVFSTGEVLLPTRYTVDDEGLRIDRPLGGKSLSWSQLSGFTSLEEGFEVTGRGPHRWVRRRRSARIRCPGRREQVEAELRRFLP